MTPAYQKVEKLLAQIRVVAHSPVVERATDQISVLCSAYMEPDQTNQGIKHGLRGAKAAIFDLLHKRLGQVVTRHALLGVLTHVCESVDEERTLRVHLCHLRPHAKRQGFTIENIHSVGYRMLNAA